MTYRKNHRSKLVFWILSLMLVLLSIFLVFQVFSFSGTTSRLSKKRIQQSVYHEDDVLQQAKVDLLYAFDHWNYTGTFRPLDYNVPSSVGVYVFNEDSLLYWNTNVIEPKLLRKRVILGTDTIVNLNHGDYLISSTAYGSCSFYLFSLLNTTYPIENKYFTNKYQPFFGNHKVSFGFEPATDGFPVLSRAGKTLAFCTLQYPSAWSSSNLPLLIVCTALVILCAYLLLSRYLTIKRRNRRQPPKIPLGVLILALAFVVVLILLAFRRLFVYGFSEGFLIPTSIKLDYCFLALFGLVLTAVSFSMLLLWLMKPWLKKSNVLLWTIAQFVLWGITLTLLYNREYTRYENHQIQSLAVELSDERDADFERSYQDFLVVLQQDTVLGAMVGSQDAMEEVLVDYMRSFLFDTVMNGYNVTLTICTPGQELIVQPYDTVSDCMEVFREQVKANHGQDLGDALYLVDYNSLDPNYLSVLFLEAADTMAQQTLFLEFSKPIAPQGFGLPKMLQDEHNAFLQRSSVASYRDSLLVYKFGSYIYPNYLADYKHPINEFSYGRKMKHYVYQADDSNVLAISLERKGWMEKTAPFAVFFFMMLAQYLLIYFLGGLRRDNPAPKTLSNRFQMVVLVALGLSFMVIGPISVLFIRSLYTQKANETHFDRTRSISLDITGEVDFSFLRQPGFKTMLDDILKHYSETFFTDINVYDVSGKLMATTCPEIMELQLQSSLMNAEAYHNMQGERSLYYIHEEKLGQAVYQSSYISIQDDAGKTLAYLNIPYFSGRSDLETEILNYVMMYVNIILLIIFVFLPVVLIVTRRVTDPLVRLQEKMRQVDINKTNEKLEWKSNDEIGALINQYNQLVVELEKSAAELRRTTTESAWRGVARQVAHEIKNSLTPMRLSVQMLQRNIENGKATQEQIQRTTTTLIEQIDALSDIASSFSQYAKLPVNNPQPLNLADLVGNIVNLYNNADNIAFVYKVDTTTDYTFNGDKTNLNSAIGNIVKNATQAIGEKPGGKIEVSLKATDTEFVIMVKDNGKGIKEEDKKMIFLPNFTTKTGGSGVGLSLAYNIVQSAGGTVTFESEEGKGTVFIIQLPRAI